MYCQTHRLHCRQLCLEQSCRKAWGVCPKCPTHSHHRTTLSSDLHAKISSLAQMQNSFQTSLKNYLMELISNEVLKTTAFIKSTIQNAICQELRNIVRIGEFGCEPEIELAIKQYEKEGKFKEKHRQKLINIEFNLEYEKEVQRSIKETETHKIQSIFFDLLHNLKQVVNNVSSKSYSIKEQTRQSFYKKRSFSNNSTHTLSSTSSFQRKRKKSTMSKPNIFNDVTSSKVKKMVTNKIKFVEEPTSDVNRSQEFLKMMEEKLANSRKMNKIMMSQEPFIKPQDYEPGWQKRQEPMNQPTHIVMPISSSPTQGSFSYNPQNHSLPIPIEKSQPMQETLRQIINYSQNPTYVENHKLRPSIQESVTYSSKEVSKQITFNMNRQNNRLERSSIKSIENSRIQPRNRSTTNLKKNSKIQKRVEIVKNNTEESVEQIIKLEQLQPAKATNPKFIQQMQARLKIVPEVSGFLKQHLSEIQEIWEASNNSCWKMYFEIKEELEVKESKYDEEKDMVARLTYLKTDIIEQLEYNIKNTKIKTISKHRNHLILQYLVKYSAELLILFEGTNIQNTGFSAEKYLTTLQNLAEGDVKGAFAYMTSNLNKLKQLV